MTSNPEFIHMTVIVRIVVKFDIRESINVEDSDQSDDDDDDEYTGKAKHSDEDSVEDEYEEEPVVCS